MRNAILILAAGLALAGPAAARPGDIAISGAEIRASLGGSTNTAAYLTISNTGAEADRLVAVSCACAAAAEAHATGMKGAMMTMAPAGPVAIPAHGHVSFAPGGLHIMLTGLKAPLLDGGRQEMVLRFEHAGPVRAHFQVRARIVGGGAQSMGAMPGMPGMSQ